MALLVSPFTWLNKLAATPSIICRVSRSCIVMMTPANAMISARKRVEM
jgi:hypothetical protein